MQFREKDKKKKVKPAGIVIEDEQPKKRSKDMEKEKFEEIIIKNSTCMFEYGKGKQIEYNIAHIQKQSIELLLQGKQKIEFNTKFNF